MPKTLQCMSVSHIIFNNRNELIRINPFKVVYYEAYGNYSYAVFTNGVKVILPVGLTDLQQILVRELKERARIFLHIGRRFIVNTEFVVKVCVPKQQLTLCDMVSNTRYNLPISKEALKKIKNMYINKQIWN